MMPSTTFYLDSVHQLRNAVDALRFRGAVACVYNPLDYARAMHDAYVSRFAGLGADVILLGMNPGPWGMAQTGIPFGEVNAVRDWLEIREHVSRPAVEHPKRPILGLECTRSEVSGRRVWDWAASRFASASDFCSRFFVANYCPLCFMSESGSNLTPDKLPATERARLFEVCDVALRSMVSSLRPRMVVGVGVFAEQRAAAALADDDVAIGRILHPSPASPLANRGWADQAEVQLRALGIGLPPKC